MKIGLVGFAGSGKTTFFNALTGLDAATGNTGSLKVHLGTIAVPDPRIDALGDLYHTRSRVFAEIACVDVPGRASTAGKGLDSATLENIRDTSALALVLGAFQPDADPAREAASFRSELVFTDLLLVDKRLNALRNDHDRKRERQILEELHGPLEDGRPLSEVPLETRQQPEMRAYAFVSDKPMIAVLNVDETTLESGRAEGLKAAVEARGLPAFVLSGRLEAELAALEPAEQAAFLKEMGLGETARTRFIHAAYAALDLITFLTSGEDECRAWPIRRGMTARQAAGRIHTDLEKGFIRAEVFHFDDLMKAGSEAELKKRGKLRLEGKDYIVVDGDIMVVHHSK